MTSRARECARSRARSSRGEGSEARVASRPAIPAVLFCDASRVSSIANSAKLTSTIALAAIAAVRRSRSSTVDRVRRAWMPDGG